MQTQIHSEIGLEPVKLAIGFSQTAELSNHCSSVLLLAQIYIRSASPPPPLPGRRSFGSDVHWRWEHVMTYTGRRERVCR